MRSFKVPFKKTYSDKIIGGWITLRQLVYIIIPIALIGICIGNYSIFTYRVGALEEINWTAIIVAGVFWIAIAIACIGIAFIKVNETTLDKYLIKKFIFATKRKHIKFYQ